MLHLLACFFVFPSLGSTQTYDNCIAFLGLLLCFLVLFSLALYFRSNFGPVLFDNVTFQKGDLSFTASVSPVLSASCVSDPIHCI